MNTYLISLYFDEKTTEYLDSIKEGLMKKTGSDSMKDIRPHLTVGMLKANSDAPILEKVKLTAEETERFELLLPSAGIFKNSVVYLYPVLNKALLSVSKKLHYSLFKYVPADSKYVPYNWMPHITMARHLTAKQQLEAIEYLQGVEFPKTLVVDSIGLDIVEGTKNTVIDWFEMK